MSKAKMLGYFKPYTPNNRAGGKQGQKTPWQGIQKRQKKGSENNASKHNKD